MDGHTCQECGGKGVDVGSLHEPEPCPVCLGSGKMAVELDPSSSLYLERKPIARVTLLPAATVGGFAERGRHGD